MSEILPGDLVRPNGLMRIVPGYTYAGYDRENVHETFGEVHEPSMFIHSDRCGVVLALHESSGLFLLEGEPALVEALILCPDVGYAWFDIANFVKVE